MDYYTTLHREECILFVGVWCKTTLHFDDLNLNTMWYLEK